MLGVYLDGEGVENSKEARGEGEKCDETSSSVYLGPSRRGFGRVEKGIQ